MSVFVALAACTLTLAPAIDYRYLLATGVSGEWRATRDGQPWLSGPAPLRFPDEGSFPLDEGSFEMRIAAREDGSSATYATGHTLMSYRAANGDYLSVTQAASGGILYLGGTVRGAWQSAYGGRGSMSGWKAGEFHHVMATWSASANRMRFYLDGVLTADTNEKHYWPPSSAGGQFKLESSVFELRDVVTWGKEVDADEVRAHAMRTDSPKAGEVWLPVSELREGERLTIVSDTCASEPLEWLGVPVRDAEPPSTLLPSGTTQINLNVKTPIAASCRYAVNSNLPWDEMAPLEGPVTGLSGDSRRVDQVFVRCSNAPEFGLRLLYRSMPTANPRYPRKSNLWGSANMTRHGYDFASKVDLYLGAEMSGSEIRELRARNPEILVLTSINTVENRGLPEDYYLHDLQGGRIEVWPGTYRLNLTKTYVAEYQARWAYQKMLDSEMMYDGCFFDNFFTSQSWLKSDIHGRAVVLDANEDGKPDDPAWLDAAWRAGVFAELALWRKLMPHAYATGHLPNPSAPELGEIFNGNAILFWATNVLDGQRSFAEFSNVIDSWNTLGRTPVLNTIEASPHNQIAYGYGYDMQKTMPAATLEFARDFHRYMRFPLAVTLMSDGYFHRDLGDIVHGVDWWYDEYDFDLGYPEGPAEIVSFLHENAPELLLNGDFEHDFAQSWSLAVDSRGSAKATLARVDGVAVIDVTATSVDWHVDFHQRDRTLEKGKSYVLRFQARASEPRVIALSSQKGVVNWRNYGLSQKVTAGTEWQDFAVTFEANETANDARIQFFLGAQTGQVWIDNVSLKLSEPPVWRRYFTQGAVVLNASKERVTVQMPAGYEHFEGAQAARYQYIVDDEDAGFTPSDGWKTAKFDTGQWKAAGPYYHHWGSQCRTLNGAGEAQWDLRIPEDGTYTIEAWWATAPVQAQWTTKAVYEVVVNGAVVASGTLDQTKPGDQWRAVATVDLRAFDQPVLRIRNEGAGTLVADAIHVRSAARLNDGTPAAAITLEPMDGILLRRR